jgi:serine phosphatase RsbU (regulator of sigma subunit)
MALAAEMQWALLPIRAFDYATFSIAGQLVPAYEVGGDMFDHALSNGSLLVAATDAMGHGLRASLLTTLTVNTLRNARRSGASIDAQAATADRTLNAQFGGDQFVTALIMQIDLATGQLAVVNAGAPPAYRVDGGAVETVRFEADLPLGMFGSTPYAIQHSVLQSGQRLVLVSDGVLEAEPRDGGEPYGDRRLEGALLATRHLRPHEAVRLIAAGVRSYRNTHLRDDATIVCLDWK